MRIMHNLASLNIFREHSKVIERQSKVLGRISSGYKINSAKDDPNRLGSSERLRLQIRGLEMAQRNAQDGVSMLQTADGALENVTSMLHRIRELTVQSGGATSSFDKEKIQDEVDQMVKGIEDIVKNTEFNGVHLLNSKEKVRKMPIGANVGEEVEIPMYDLSSDKLGIKNLDVKNLDNSLKSIDEALDMTVSVRSKYGALENRFESSYNKIGEIHDTIVGSESQLRDADIAEEMMNYTRDNILIDSGYAMMVQSNKLPQDVLRVLENIRNR